jgi:hypothetical protein
VRTWLAALVASALLAGCAPSIETTGAEITSATPIADVFGPRFELIAEATAIERFDPPGAGAGLGVAIASTVRNPNDFPITLEQIDYALVLRGRVVTRAVLEPALLLEPGATESIAWRVDTDLTDLRELWRPVVDAFAGTPLPFSIEGSVRFTSQSYAFTTGTRTLLEGTVLATQAVAPPRLRLDGRESRVTVVRADAPVVSLALFATNRGDVGYFLSGRELVLELNDEVVASLDLGPVPLPAGETGRVDLVFIVDRARLSAAARGAIDLALWGERADVRVSGAFVYDVLGVDSYPADVGDGLRVSLPSSQLPRLERPAVAAPASDPIGVEDDDAGDADAGGDAAGDDAGEADAGDDAAGDGDDADDDDAGHASDEDAIDSAP